MDLLLRVTLMQHETQAFRLHALVQDAEPRAVQSRNERRGAYFLFASCRLI